MPGALWMLHELNRIDKHRLPAITLAVPAMTGISFNPASPTVDWHIHWGAELHDGTEIGYLFDIDRPAGRIEVRGDIAPKMRFGDACEAVVGLDVIAALRHMSREVTRVLDMAW